MMSVSEHDLEMLETYLDGALDSGDSVALKNRLATDPALSSALEELRAERSMRKAVWSALEPDQMTADRLTWRVQGAMAVEQSSPRRSFGIWQMTRIGSAAAACLVLGFFIGRAGHPSSKSEPLALQPDSSLAINSNSNSNPTAPATNAGLLVPVTNEYGQVVAWQPFGNSSDAKAFTEDLHRARGSGITTPADVRLASQETPQKF